MYKGSISDPSNKEEYLPKVMKCGFIIYDLTIDKTQIHKALWTVKGNCRC
jgi:hypothetical protein